MSEMRMIDPEWAWQPFRPTAARPWNKAMAAHLLRRAGFGAEYKTIVETTQRPAPVVVDDLVSRNREPSDFRFTADALAEATIAGNNPATLSAAWVYRLLHTPNQLLEKTALFWHGHFATGAEKVQDARMMWNQNQLLREHALGDFGDLVHHISQDPAMLVYLDSTTNRKAHPNENFARELMELFCLGEGNYTERDVQELARCFTGCEVRQGKFRKNRYQHDSDSKSVLGQTGGFDDVDGVRVVLEQPSVERFIVRKLYRFFVCDEPEPSDELLQPLVNLFRQVDLQVAPVLKSMLSSNLFFSEHSVGRKIKSPVELVIGMLRAFKATTNTQLIAQSLRDIGQGLFYPPNVKGWDGGRAWINSSTLLGRANLIADILANDATRFDGGTLSDYLRGVGAKTTDEVIGHFEDCLLAVRLDDTSKSELRDATASQSGDNEKMLRSLLHTFTSLPICQLG